MAVSSFFAAGDGDWFTPTEFARGPWDPQACHAGPPTALLVRASEQAVPGLRLARLAVDLERPVPMASFGVTAEIVRSGRTTATTALAIVDRQGRTVVRARGLHVSVRHVLEATAGDDFVPPALASSPVGPFPFSRMRHDLPGFRDAVEMRYPPGQDNGPGATTFWMRSIGILPGEEMSPFQRVCCIADCTNAFSRHHDGMDVGFINADLHIALHRDPIGEWIGSSARSVWEPTGVAVAHARLFDEHGSIGVAVQTLVLTPAS